MSKLPAFFTLASGDRVPSVALGTWKAEKGSLGPAVKAALKAGYRHIDGAWEYRNEDEIGEAIQESHIPREQLWITSKLWNAHHAPDDIEPALDNSLSMLKTSYLDMYLMHWPIALKKNPNAEKDTDYEWDPELTSNIYATWKKMEEMVDKGKVKNIGVSNFTVKKLKELLSHPLKYKPAVNQVELNYFNPQPELLNWAKQNNLLLEAYSPLGSSKQVHVELDIPEIKEIANTLKITPAQVISSWHLQRGVVAVIKSVNPERIEGNIQTRLLPQELFDRLEKAATSHRPERMFNPSNDWKLPFDVFEE